jgi:hypothetical protein
MLKHQLVSDIFTPIFQRAKEVTAFMSNDSIAKAGAFKHNWSFQKDRMKANDIRICHEDFTQLWFHSNIAIILDNIDFLSRNFFSYCNDPGVLLNPRTAYGKNLWNYVRYRVDTYDAIALCTAYHDHENLSNTALSRPIISLVARGTTLERLLSEAFKSCHVTNYFSVKHENIEYLRIGRITFNEAHFKKQGNDLNDGYGEMIEEKLRDALGRKGVLHNLYFIMRGIEFDYHPETWPDVVSVLQQELRQLNVPESTRIVSNSHPCKKIEMSVYNNQ